MTNKPWAFSILAVVAAFFAGSVHAVSLPAGCGTAPLANCSLNGTSSTCTCTGNVTISQNVTVGVTSTTDLIFTGTASLNVQQNGTLGTSGKILNVNVTGSGTITLDQNSTTYASLQTTTGTITVSQNGDAVGNITSTSGTVVVSNNGTVTGNVSAPIISGGGTVSGTCSGSVSGTSCSGGTTAYLLANYHFDECSYNGTSGEVTDANGRFPATSKGAIASTDSAGNAVGGSGRYLNLSALNQYIQPNAQIPLPRSYTLAFWMKFPLPTADAATPIYATASVGPAGASNYGDFFNFRSDNGYPWRVFQKSKGGANGTAVLTGLSSGWHHFAVVGSGTSSTLYIDGVQKDTVARIANGDLTTLGLNYIGAGASDPTTQALRTPIDEFLVFSGALTTTQIGTIKTNQSAGKNYDGATVTRPSCSALDHIRVEHDGSGNYCTAETLTVKACANAACSSLYTAGAVTGNVTWGSSTIPFSISPGSSSTTVSLSNSSTASITLGTSSVSPTPANSSDCTNTAASSTSCSMSFVSTGGCFDAVEVGAASGTRIYTKLAGTAFNLDVRTTSGSAFTGTLNIALVDPNASTGNCLDNATGLTAEVSTSYSATASKTLSFNYPDAAKLVKVRIRDTALSTPSCSTDSFSIRPSSFSITGTAVDPALNTLKAGRSDFTLTADAGVTKGYLGSVPTLDSTKVTDHTGATIGSTTLAGLFTAATAVGSSVSGSGFRYSEVGTFTLGTNAFVDSTFTATDQPGDCVASSTSTTLTSSKYGCNIGSAAMTSALGSFTPNNYKTVVTHGCPGGTFTYSGQPITVAVTAYNYAGSVTTRFDNVTGASYTRDVSLTAIKSDGTAASGTLTPDTVLASAFSAGTATIATPVFTFTTRTTAPETIYLRATDVDSISSSSFAEGSTEIRSGRLRLLNSYGSVSPLYMPVETQYWSGKSWIKNSVDSCTTTTGTTPQVTFTAAPSTGWTLTPNAFASGAMSGGGLKLEKAPPGTTAITATAPNWLKPDPSANAIVGIYGTKESRKAVHIRETY